MSVSSGNPERPLFDWYIQNYHRANSQSAVDQAQQAERLFEDFIEQKGVKPESVDEGLAYEFIQRIVDEYSPNYQKKVVGEVNRFYSYCLSKGVNGFDGNPFDAVLMEHDLLEKIREPEPHMISPDEMSEYLLSINNPRCLTPTLTMAKTTRRIGEVINLDLIDLNLAHPACDWDVHPKVRHKTDYIYFGPEAEKGEEYRGEVRHCSSKTESCRIVPVDSELKQAILWYLSIRPGSTDPHSPLFKAARNATKRLHRDTLADKIVEHSKEMGHYYGPDDEDSITSHYFRHWSTNQLRERMTGDSGLVDYIRGDSASDMKDRYTHWSDQKEKEYLDIVPKFFD